MRTELYSHISSIYANNFTLLTPNEQLKVLMSEQFIHLPIDFVEQAWRKRQSVMFNLPSYIYSNVFFPFLFFLNYYYVFTVLLLCYVIQLQVTNKPLRAGYQFLILYFLFERYVCTMSL